VGRPTTGIAFGHRRLSIIDLSPTGHQPMHSACGRYVITFNGEIYNFKALRQDSSNSAKTFRGHSDTEIMLAAIARWGVEASVKKFNGMFAFGLWDRAEQTLYLSRDPRGRKAAYYGWAGKTLLFGSELKALQQHPDFRGDVDRGALAIYVRHNYIPAPHSIYKGSTNSHRERFSRFAVLEPMHRQDLIGPREWPLKTDSQTNSAARKTKPLVSSTRCSMTPCRCAWNPMCRWARFYPVALIRR